MSFWIRVGLVSVALAIGMAGCTELATAPGQTPQVIPTARMTNMAMTAISASVKTLGQGNYRVQLKLSMAGPWEISIVARADGANPA